MNKILNYLPFLFCFLVLGCIAQNKTNPQENGYLSGQIIDNETRKPIAGAVIYLNDNPETKEISDDDGFYKFSCKKGSAVLKCKAKGYKEASKSIFVTQNSHVNMELIFKPIKIDTRILILKKDIKIIKVYIGEDVFFSTDSMGIIIKTKIEKKIDEEWVILVVEGKKKRRFPLDELIYNNQNQDIHFDQFQEFE